MKAFKAIIKPFPAPQRSENNSRDVKGQMTYSNVTSDIYPREHPVICDI